MNEIIIGIIQGITEFLPISSSGHLVIFDILSDSINLNTNDIAFLHIGTLFSIVVFYKDRLSQTFNNKNNLNHWAESEHKKKFSIYSCMKCNGWHLASIK